MIDYISKVINYKLDKKSSSQYAKLVQGFTIMVGDKFSSLFSPWELKTLLYGENQYFEISDLKPFTIFQFGSLASAKFLENSFWQVLQEFTPQEQSDFLFFVTSSHRPPVGGFQYLDPPLTIKFENSITKYSLPRAFTCGNSLYLSVYYDKKDLKEKLKKAISLNDGFCFA
jgi:ubiquitin-protein ligase E3 B